MRFYTYVDSTYFFDIHSAVIERLRDKRKKNLFAGKKTRNRDAIYKTALDCLLANLIQAHLEGKPIAIGRRESHYKNKSNPKNVSAYVMREIVDQLSSSSKKGKKNPHEKFDGLMNLGIIELLKRGFHDKTGRGKSTLSLYQTTEKFRVFAEMPQRSRAAAKQKTLSIKTLKLREPLPKIECYLEDDEGKRKYFPIDYQNRDVKATIETLDLLEDCLSKHQFKISFVKFDSPKLTRKFNATYNGHGRIYCDGGVFQNWRREFVEQLQIDNEPVSELDFSSTHISIAYAERGRLCPSDAYVLSSLSAIQDQKLQRALGKRIVNIMLNAKDRKTAESAIRNAFAKEGIKYGNLVSIPELIAEIEEKHQPISDLFYSNAGLRLQKIESDICLKILDLFARLMKPIIPKHDSFIVKRNDQTLLKEAMQTAWIEVISDLKDDGKPVQAPKISIKF